MLGLQPAVTARFPRRHDRLRVAAIFRLRFSVASEPMPPDVNDTAAGFLANISLTSARFALRFAPYGLPRRRQATARLSAQISQKSNQRGHAARSRLPARLDLPPPPTGTQDRPQLRSSQAPGLGSGLASPPTHNKLLSYAAAPRFAAGATQIAGPRRVQGATARQLPLRSDNSALCDGGSPPPVTDAAPEAPAASAPGVFGIPRASRRLRR
jgi:hypothetical protein